MLQGHIAEGLNLSKLVVYFGVSETRLFFDRDLVKKPDVSEALAVLGSFIETTLKGAEDAKKRQNPDAGKEGQKPQDDGITTPSASKLHGQRTAKTEDTEVRKVKRELIDGLKHNASSENSDQTLESGLPGTEDFDDHEMAMLEQAIISIKSMRSIQSSSKKRHNQS